MSELCVIELRTHGRGPYSLRIDAGECVSLRGASGSGKSLLLRAITDLDPHEGQVLLDGTPSTQLPAPQWRRRVTLLPAESQWWQDSVGAHFTREECPWLAPLGFSREVLDWPVSRLSSGEKQRLALARALMNRPWVLLLDEPTASLDADNVAIVETLISEYRTHNMAAVLWVSHDAEQAARVGERHLWLTPTGLEETST